MNNSLNKLKLRFITLLTILFFNNSILEVLSQEEKKENKILNLNISNIQKNINYDETQINKENKKIIYFENIKNLLERNNEELRILRSKIIQSEATLKNRKAAWSPTLDLNSSELPKYTIGETTNISSGNTSTNQLTTGLNTTLKLDIYNPLRNSELKIAKDNLKNEKLKYESRFKDLYLESLRIYFEAIASNEEINVAEKSLEISKIALKDSKNRFEGGLGNKMEVLEADTQLGRDILNLTRRKGQLKNNKTSLQKILNIDFPINFEKVEKKRILGMWNIDLDKSLESAYKNDENLKISKNDIAINKNKSLSILSGKKPFINLYNTYSISKAKGESGVANPDKNNDINTSNNTVGINFSWNLFDGGRIKQNNISNINKTEELEISLRNSKLDLKKRIQDTLTNLNIAKQNIITSYQQLISSKESLEISLKRLEAGITTQREIVNTQGDVSESESNYINSLTDYNINILTMKRLTGLEEEIICNVDVKKADIIDRRFITFLKKVGISSCSNIKI